MNEINSYTPCFIYLVCIQGCDYEYSWNEVLGAFSSRDKAETYVLELCEAYEKLYPQFERSPDYYTIEEYDLDHPTPAAQNIGY